MRTSSKLLASILLATPMAVFSNADPLVNPNRAGASEIQEDLTGVTEQQASEIVQYRQERGYFDSKEELTKVQGIGRDDVNINRDYLYLNEEDKEFSG